MKNAVTAAIIAVVILANGGIALLRADAGSQLQADQSQIASLVTANDAAKTQIDALIAAQAQTAASLVTLRTAVAQLAQGAGAAQAEFNTVMQAIKPSVVKLNATGPGLRGYGSGVIVRSSGYVLTVLHAVSGAGSITVTLSTGEQFQATITASDAASNLALLKMTTTRTDFPAAPVGSINNLSLAQTVIAAGFPLSPELDGPATFTVGIVSALRTAADYYFVQSDADIAPGSGGGGLFTLDGRLVAVASLAQADGIYLYIPVNAAASLLAGIG
ncbi:trypsin-like peptidase domain-containing protein [Dehalogenimonas sp. 4OHTPN]|uniref:Trypsin-like peptidase domain-containing protein n=1 Tax=Dehalogenimonas sp. 4OHTPN TaxID=3166643 RepID=A0AAU8G9L6_9CHLR